MIKGTIYLTIASFFFVISSYVINVWLGRTLGPEDYGIYGVIISLVAILNLVQTSGIPQAMTKLISEDTKRSDDILKSGLIVQVLLSIFIAATFYLLASPISVLLNDPSLTPYLKLASLIFPFYGLLVALFGYYNGLHNFKTQALLNILYAIFKATAVIALTIYFHLSGALYGFIITPLLCLLIGFHIPKLSKKLFAIRTLIKLSMPLALISFLSILLQSLDLIFIKALLNSQKDPGYYTAGQNISRVIYFGLSAISLVIFPSISSALHQNLPEKTKYLVKKSLHYILILLIPSTVLLSVSSKQVLEILYSNTYLPASGSLSILVIGMGFLTIFNLLSNILNGAGMYKATLLISFTGVIITSLLCLLLIPRYGMEGAAWATTINSFVITSISAGLVYNKFKVLVTIPQTLKLLLPGFLIAFVANFIHPSLIMLPFSSIILVALYFLILYWFKQITREEILLLNRVFPVNKFIWKKR